MSPISNTNSCGRIPLPPNNPAVKLTVLPQLLIPEALSGAVEVVCSEGCTGRQGLRPEHEVNCACSSCKTVACLELRKVLGSNRGFWGRTLQPQSDVCQGQRRHQPQGTSLHILGASCFPSGFKVSVIHPRRLSLPVLESFPLRADPGHYSLCSMPSISTPAMEKLAFYLFFF